MLRDQAGLKRYDISAKFRVDPTTVHRWETGASPIPDDVKLDLADLLSDLLGESISVAYLMGWSGEHRPEATEDAA